MPRQSAAPSLWICQCMKVVRASIFCIRYMPTLRVPVRGSRVITAGRVMKGAGSPGQQCWIGRLSRSGSMHDVLRRAAADALRQRVGEALQLAEPLDLLDQALGRLHLDHLLELRRYVVEGRLAEREAHAPFGAELVDEERVGEPFGCLKRSAGPPAFTVRSTISVASR